MDWVGRFIERASKLTLRDAYKTIVFEPLGLSSSPIDTFRTEEMNKDRSAIHAPLGDGAFVAIPFDTPQFEGVPPPGMATLASGPLWA